MPYDKKYKRRRPYRKRTYRKRRRPTKKYIKKVARTAGETKLSKWLWTPDGHTDNIGNQVNSPVTPARAYLLDKTANLFIPFTANPLECGWNPLTVTNTPIGSAIYFDDFIPQGIQRQQRIGAKVQIKAVNYHSELQILAIPPDSDIAPQYPVTAEFRLVIGWVKASAQLAFDRVSQINQLYSEIPYALFKVSTDRIIKRRALYSGLNATTAHGTPVTYQVPSYTDIPIKYYMNRPMNINFRTTDQGVGTSELSNWTPFILLVNPNSAIINLTTKWNRHIISFKDP